MSANVASFVTLAIGIFGVAGIVFTALRFRRDDTTAVVAQQAQITTEMKALADEQRIHLQEMREERDRLRAEVDRLTGQVQALRAQVSGKMTPIRKADDGV